MRFIESFLQKAKEIPDLVLLDDCQGTQLTYEQTDRMSGLRRFLKSDARSIARFLWLFPKSGSSWRICSI